jgi:hypothetical protein
MWRVRQLGHYYLIARSVDDVKEFFTEHNLEEK